MATIKTTGSFRGKSNKVGGGGRFAQIAAKAGGGKKGAAISMKKREEIMALTNIKGATSAITLEVLLDIRALLAKLVSDKEK